MRVFARPGGSLTRKNQLFCWVGWGAVSLALCGCEDEGASGPRVVEGRDAAMMQPDASPETDMGVPDGAAPDGMVIPDATIEPMPDLELPDAAWDADLPDAAPMPDMEVFGPLAGPCRVPSRYRDLDEGGSLRQTTRRLSELAHEALSYGAARYFMFGELDNVEGRVRGVYTGQWVDVPPGDIPDIDIMNTEHTWPQSRGAGELPARSDLHHLYPVLAEANTRRLNSPMGEVVDVEWSQGGSRAGDDASGDRVFEPRDDHKGAVARAMMYFAVRYDFEIDREEESVMRRWHREFPVTEAEAERHDLIWVRQGNRNPFIDCPHLVDEIEDF